MLPLGFFQGLLELRPNANHPAKLPLDIELNLTV